MSEEIIIIRLNNIKNIIKIFLKIWNFFSTATLYIKKIVRIKQIKFIKAILKIKKIGMVKITKLINLFKFNLLNKDIIILFYV